jgi:membrane protease subunit HflC
MGTRPNMGRDKISELILSIAAKITPQYGIELIDVMFKRVNYIESVRLKVYDRMISERKRIAAEKRSMGEGQKAEILGTVDRELKEILSEANRDALLIRGGADAKATKIYGIAYSQDPDFYDFQKTLESYQSVIGENTSLVLSSDSDLYRYLNSAEGK